MLLKIAKRVSRKILRAIDEPFLHVYNRYINVDSDDIVILVSVPKSGTTFLRYIITNYLRLLQDSNSPPVTYDEMDEHLFPNEKRFRPPLGYRPPSDLMNALKYRDIYNTHRGAEFMRFSKADIIFLYRNPLDNMISRFYYFYKYRPARAQEADGPQEIIDIELPKFIRQYALMKSVCQRKKRAIAISYESLINAPFETAYFVLNWLGAPMRVGLLRKAIEISSFDKIRKEEEERLGPIGSPKGFQGFFTRSGKIGQWKKYFSDRDVARIRAVLENHGISLDEFILEYNGD